MDSQFKKGILDICVLGTVYQKDRYGYELIDEVSKVIEISKGTLYPVLKRLQNDKFLDYYIVESENGPPRKYYKITNLGIMHFRQKGEEWINLSKTITTFIKEVKNNE